MSPLVLQMLPMVSGKVHEVHQQVGGIFGEVFCHKHKRLILWLTCRNAYIVCAMRSSNFCSSAKHAFELLIKNLVRVVVLNKGKNNNSSSDGQPIKWFHFENSKEARKPILEF